eukprot:gene18264-20084_t
MAKFCVLVCLLAFAQLHTSSAWLFGKDFTFPVFHDMPMTEDDAKDDGWQKTDNLACDGHSYFVGVRYQKGRDTLLYDSQGVLAGIQGTLASTTIVSTKYKDMVTLDQDGLRYVTAYFTNPSTICKNPNRKSGCVGDALYIQNGKTPQSVYRVPLAESGLAGSKWVKGKCFVGMGQHYWYNVSREMNCATDFFPAFLLYDNNGKLAAFGWAFGGDAQNAHFEHPPVKYLGYFFQPATQPKCLASYNIRSTQHIYFTSGIASSARLSCVGKKK